MICVHHANVNMLMRTIHTTPTSEVLLHTQEGTQWTDVENFVVFSQLHYFCEDVERGLFRFVGSTKIITSKMDSQQHKE